MQQGILVPRFDWWFIVVAWIGLVVLAGMVALVVYLLVRSKSHNARLKNLSNAAVRQTADAGSTAIKEITPDREF
jgi:ABC-type protease/lipase transport system fused ATPase/permease subunit